MNKALQAYLTPPRDASETRELADA
jgi:hypothetical protein